MPPLGPPCPWGIHFPPVFPVNFLVNFAAPAAGVAGSPVRMPLASTSFKATIPGLGGRKPLAAAPPAPVNPQARRPNRGSGRALFQAQCLSCCQGKGG